MLRTGEGQDVDVAPGVEDLEVAWGPMRPGSMLHLAVLRDPEAGVTLVDTGGPGEADAVEEALGRLGIGIGEVRHIVVTHQDMDHVGNLPQLVRRSGAEVWAHADDVPYIQGERQPLKWSPERTARELAAVPAEHRNRLAAALDPLPAAHVDRLLSDGEVLPMLGGVQVVHTPGHTPGHISLYVRQYRLVIAADAVHGEGDRLGGTNPNAPDMALALKSVAKLAQLPGPVEYILCYHGGLYGPGIAARLAEVAGSSEAPPR